MEDVEFDENEALLFAQRLLTTTDDDIICEHTFFYFYLITYITQIAQLHYCVYGL